MVAIQNFIFISIDNEVYILFMETIKYPRHFARKKRRKDEIYLGDYGVYDRKKPMIY